MNPIETFAAFLIENAESISRDIVNYNIAKLDITLPQDIIEHSVKINSEFFRLLGHSLHSSDEDAVAEFVEWHKKQVTEQPETSLTFKDMASLIRPYADTRMRLIEMVTKISVNEGLSTEEVVFINNRISYMLDLAITETIIERERVANERNKRHEKVITELSSPIVPIQDGMAILPLIGEFDLDRSDHIMNHVIPRISELKVQCLVIDFSGMAGFDSEVASRIFKIHDVLGLLGIESLFTGIRPDLVTKIISAGIDLKSIKTYGNVQQAILSKAAPIR